MPGLADNPFEFPRSVDGAESLTRYLLEKKGKFGTDPPAVKYRAFLAPLGGLLSVYRIGGLDTESIWGLARELVSRERPALARGDFLADAAYSNGLGLIPTESPHPRHVNIDGLPSSASDTKDRVAAIRLAQACTLHLAPQTS